MRALSERPPGFNPIYHIYCRCGCVFLSFSIHEPCCFAEQLPNESHETSLEPWEDQ